MGCGGTREAGLILGAAVQPATQQRLKAPAPLTTSPAPAKPWVCATCTFENGASAASCALGCGGTREAGVILGSAAPRQRPIMLPPAPFTPPPAAAPATALFRRAASVGGGAAASPAPPAPAPQSDARIIFHGTGDGCSAREDQRLERLLEDVTSRGAGGDFADAAFPPTDASAGAFGGLTVTFSGGERGPQKVSIPLCWRRARDLADEDGGFAPGARVNLKAELDALVRDAKAAGARSQTRGTARGVPVDHLEYLAEQARRKDAAGDYLTSGLPWCFRRDRFRAEDVVQGSLGVCWFVSALSLVAAQREDLVSALFHPRPLHDALTAAGERGASTNAPRLLPLSPSGMYAVRLCIDGLWRWIVVDDVIPASGFDGSPAFSSARRRQLWVPIVEKAAAKAVGSYAGLVSGTTAEGLRLLTGAPVSSFQVQTAETEEERHTRRANEGRDDFSARASGGGGDGWGEWDLGKVPPADVLDALWVQMCSWHDAGFLCGVSTGVGGEVLSPAGERRVSADEWRRRCRAFAADVAAAGLAPSHAYALLRPLQCPTTGVRLVHLRNPWGEGGSAGGWNGSWSDASREWSGASRALRDMAGPLDARGTGCFFMSLDDFARFFSRIDCSRVRPPDWITLRARLPLPCRTGAWGVQLTPLGPGATEIDVVLNDVTLEGGGSAGGGGAMPGSGRVRWRRIERTPSGGNTVSSTGGAQHDLALVLVRDADGVAAQPPPPQLPHLPTSTGDALASAVTGTCVVGTSRRALALSVGLEVFLDASRSADGRTGKPHTLLPLSLGSSTCAPRDAGFVLLELHHQSARPLGVELVSLSPKQCARIVLARTLKAGALMSFSGDAFKHVMVVGHADGAGEIVAAVHRGGNKSPFRIDLELSGRSLRTGALTALRGVEKSADDVEPRSARILNALSSTPSEDGGIAWAKSVGLKSRGEGTSVPPLDEAGVFGAVHF